MLARSLLLAALLPLLVLAQDGDINGPTSNADAAGYSCDASKCQLPNCNCASVKPPGGLDPVSAIHFPTLLTSFAITAVAIHLRSVAEALFGSIGRCPAIHCVHGRRCYSSVHFEFSQSVPCSAQEPQRVPTLHDLLYFSRLH